MGAKLSWSKGKYGQCIDWIGTTNSASHTSFSVRSKPKISWTLHSRKESRMSEQSPCRWSPRLIGGFFPWLTTFNSTLWAIMEHCESPKVERQPTTRKRPSHMFFVEHTTTALCRIGALLTFYLRQPLSCLSIFGDRCWRQEQLRSSKQTPLRP